MAFWKKQYRDYDSIHIEMNKKQNLFAELSFGGDEKSRAMLPLTITVPDLAELT